MRLKTLKWALCSLVVLAGCTDDKKDNEEVTPTPPPGPIGEMEVMTPEQSKVFLQNTATKALDLFKPEDQKAIIELGAYYEEQYGDYDFPEFDLESPRSYMKALSQAARGNIDALASAATSYTYTIKFDSFTGIYEPNEKREEWVKTGESNDIIFKFKNKANQPVELKMTQSGGVSDVDFSLIDWDWDYNDKTGQYEEYEIKYNYFLSIPKTLSLTLTENGNVLAFSNVQSSIDVKAHTLSANIQSTLMNISAEAKVTGTDSKVEASSEVTVSGTKLASAYAAVNGSNLCNKSKYESFEDMEDDEIEAELAKMLKSANAQVDILGEVQVYGQANYYREFPRDITGYYDSYDYENDKSAAQSEGQKACARLNQNVKTQVRYNNTATDQATIQFLLGYESWGSYGWEYFVTNNILFPDNTSYELDGYFENFTTVSNKWDMLVSSYEKMMKQAAGRK